jgi:BioD-like phosphotransacetylase family protein
MDLLKEELRAKVINKARDTNNLVECVVVGAMGCNMSWFLVHGALVITRAIGKILSWPPPRL